MKLSLFSFLCDLISFIDMIQEATMDLNEEGGSTKDVISQFIMTKYDVFQVRRGNRLQKVKERIEVQEHRNGMMGIEDQPESDEL
ncbi:hypothetical protein OIU76_030479 [Salix suchowensis]|nr:hypothetical protein OIU76_030479 [Salix suchowensis]KAJ6369196.1 hypothetical protein OIU78_001538 [Salix suchowensis]